MENKDERVLADSLARVIDNDELAEVSGGSLKITSSPSGTNSRYRDGISEAHVDW